MMVGERIMQSADKRESGKVLSGKCEFIEPFHPDFRAYGK